MICGFLPTEITGALAEASAKVASLVMEAETVQVPAAVKVTRLLASMVQASPLTEILGRRPVEAPPLVLTEVATT